MDIHGVESNEFSRFVDHSIATPFETLCYDIEKIFQSWRSEDNIYKHVLTNKIKYENNKYVLTYYNCDLNKNAFNSITSNLEPDDSIQLCSKQLDDCFQLSKFIILSTDGHWVNVTTSSRKVLFSALLVAMNSINLNDIPVFIVNLDISRIDLSTRVILGYEIKQHNAGFLSTIMYESHFLEHINSTSELYYLDGITKLFQSKLAATCIILDNNYTTLNTVCTVHEIYRCLPLKTHHVEIAFPSSCSCSTKILNTITSSVDTSICSTDCDLDYDAAKELKHLWSAFPDYISKNSLLSEIMITITFPHIKNGTFVDNCNFTTLQVTQLPPNCWSFQVKYNQLVDVSFKKFVSHDKINVDNSITDHDKIKYNFHYSTTLSSGIRRLLAYFIYTFSLDLLVSSHSLTELNNNKTETHKQNDKKNKKLHKKVYEKSIAITDEISPYLTNLLKEINTIKPSSLIHHFSQQLKCLFLAHDNLNLNDSLPSTSTEIFLSLSSSSSSSSKLSRQNDVPTTNVDIDSSSNMSDSAVTNNHIHEDDENIHNIHNKKMIPFSIFQKFSLFISGFPFDIHSFYTLYETFLMECKSYYGENKNVSFFQGFKKSLYNNSTNISHTALSIDILMASLQCMLFMISHEIHVLANTTNGGRSSLNDDDMNIFLFSEFDNLVLQIDEVTRLSRDIYVYETKINRLSNANQINNNNSTNINNNNSSKSPVRVDDMQQEQNDNEFPSFIMSFLCKVDLIAERIFTLETYILRSIEIQSILFPSVSSSIQSSTNDSDEYPDIYTSNNLIHKAVNMHHSPLSKNNMSIILETKLQVTDVLNVVKQMSMTSQNDTWLRIDGRELVFPTQKVFHMTCDILFDLSTRTYTQHNHNQLINRNIANTSSSEIVNNQNIFTTKQNLKVDIKKMGVYDCAIISSNFEEIDL